MKNLFKFKERLAGGVRRYGRVLLLLLLAILSNNVVLAEDVFKIKGSFIENESSLQSMTQLGNVYVYCFQSSNTYSNQWFRIYKNSESNNNCIYKTSGQETSLNFETANTECSIGKYGQFKVTDAKSSGTYYKVVLTYHSASEKYDVEVTRYGVAAVVETGTVTSQTQSSPQRYRATISGNRIIASGISQNSCNNADITQSGIAFGTNEACSDRTYTSPVVTSGEYSITTAELVEGTRYYYRAVLINNTNKSTGFGEEIKSFVAGAPTAHAPSVRIGKQPTTDGTTATINLQMADWGCAAVDKVKVYYTTNGSVPTTSSSSFEIEDLNIGSNTNFNVEKTGLASGTYNIKVAAHNSADYGELSDMASFTIVACVPPTLSVAHNTENAVNSIKADVGVSAFGGCSITEFGVEYSASSDMSNAKRVAGSIPSTTTPQTITISGLTSNKKYYYRAYATLDSGDDAYSSTLNCYTRPSLTASTSNVTSTSVTVFGSIASDGGLFNAPDGGNVYLQICDINTFSGEGKKSHTISSAVVGTEYSYTFTGLTPGATYYYRLYAEFTDSEHLSKCNSGNNNTVTLLGAFTTVTISDESVCVGATVTPTKSATPAATSWSYESDDTAVATVDAAGIVTGVSAGTATITATAHAANYEDKTANCTITVVSGPVITVTPDSPKAYEVITLGTQEGGNMSWAKTAGSNSAYFVGADGTAISGDPAAATESINFKAPKGSYTIAATPAGADCAGSKDISVSADTETCN